MSIMDFKKISNNSGITIVALIVTIIVMMILVGVSLSFVAGDNGILNKTTIAVDETNNASNKEQFNLAMNKLQSEYNNKKYKSESVDSVETYANFIGEKLKVGIEISKGLILKAVNPSDIDDNSLVEVNLELKKDTTIVSTGFFEKINGQIAMDGEYFAYSMGEEVALKSNSNEKFFVIEDSNKNNSTVTMFAKFNLNKECTGQLEAPYADIACKFSETNWWSDDYTENYTNLNEYGKEGENDAIAKARKYATSSNVGGESGRLLTYQEYDILQKTYPDIVYASYGTENTIMYWLGSSYEKSSKFLNSIPYVLSTNKSPTTSFEYKMAAPGDYSDDTHAGLRPVVTISKSLIQRVVE